jgi:16S rRNA (cytosine1402-N4)-methyltransferase
LDIILERCYRGDRNKYWAQVYQALRIEVNKELEVLKEMLSQGRNLLANEGRFVVISYHSLEDRIVKQFFRDNNFSGQRLEDEFGRSMNDLKALGGRPIEPTEEEVKKNRRATSAKMRVAVKMK